MSQRRARNAVRGPVIALLLVVILAACDAEADLIEYFGTPSQDATPTPSVSPVEPGATPTVQPSAPPTSGGPTPTGVPTPPSNPSPTVEPSSTPAWSPLPTRPAGLPPFAQLRATADVTDIGRLAANPGGLVGSSVYFEGRVNQVTENGGRVRARVKIGDNLIFLVYRTDRYWGDHPLVQGDRIRVVGEFVGMSGGDEQLPEIEPIDMVHRFA